MSWWPVAAAAAAPWLRIAVQPTISIKAAGNWGLTVTGIGMVALILGMGVGRLQRINGHDAAMVYAPILIAAAVLASGLAIFGIAAVQAR